MSKIVLWNLRNEKMDITIEPIGHIYDIPPQVNIEIVTPFEFVPGVTEITFTSDGGVGVSLPEEAEVFLDGKKLMRTRS